MSDTVDVWLNSGKGAHLAGHSFRPRERSDLRGTALAVSRGQAEAFYLLNEQGTHWILKKFLPGRSPLPAYIQAIQGLLPQIPGFSSGTQRRILASSDLGRQGYHHEEFASWLNHTILMPRVRGSDWATCGDELRDGRLQLSLEQRLTLCRNLGSLVAELEKAALGHRDLSSSNIFVEPPPGNGSIHLIDWDSLFHPSLSMPDNTTLGTEGYIAPWSWRPGAQDARMTWCQRADRFSLAVLCAEFILLDRGAAMTGDGGLFVQSELSARKGRALEALTLELSRRHPEVGALFERTLSAKGFDGCPDPVEWARVGLREVIKAPSLSDLPNPVADIAHMQAKLKAASSRPTPPAPSLADVEALDWTAPTTASPPPQPAPNLSDVEDPFPKRG